MCKFDHLLHILRKNFVVCVSFRKFCSKLALFAEKLMIDTVNNKFK